MMDSGSDSPGASGRGTKAHRVSPYRGAGKGYANHASLMLGLGGSNGGDMADRLQQLVGDPAMQVRAWALCSCGRAGRRQPADRLQGRACQAQQAWHRWFCWGVLFFMPVTTACLPACLLARRAGFAAQPAGDAAGPRHGWHGLDGSWLPDQPVDGRAGAATHAADAAAAAAPAAAAIVHAAE